MLENASELTFAPQAFIEFFVPRFGHTEPPAEPGAKRPIGRPTQQTSRLLRQCLNHLDPDMSYPQWFLVGAAAFNVTHGSDDGFALFDQWSSKGHKYKGKPETGALWMYYKPDHPRPATMGTIRYMVEAKGHDFMELWAATEDDFPDLDDDTEGGA